MIFFFQHNKRPATFTGMFHKTLLLIAGICFSGILFSQSIVRGTVVDPLSGNPLPGVTIKSLYPDQLLTNADGYFSILHRNGETVLIYIEFEGESLEWTNATVVTDTVDLGVLEVQFLHHNVQSEIPTISLNDPDDQEESFISGLLQTGDDLFAGIADYTFSPARFRRRGLEARYSEGFLNSVPVNDLETGGIFFSNWGGLNDVMRLDANVVGAEFSEWSLGGIAGTFNTDLRASSHWKKKQIGYAVTNRNYRNRMMATWSTGLLPAGWALSLSGSCRWAQEGYIPGTFYEGGSYFISIDKLWKAKHRLNFVVLGSPYQRGGNTISVLEMQLLSRDNYYNSSWGYQQGEKRNAKIYSAHQPHFMLRHDWKISERLSLATAFGYQTGRNNVEALDWLFANDPRPDYYRRLPSYVEQQDPYLASDIRELLASDENFRQIQWDQLYEINRTRNYTIDNVDGVAGNTISGRLSAYVMEDRRSDIDKRSGSATLQFHISNTGRFLLGAQAIYQNTHHYKVLADLLGGEFYIDWDKFAENDFPGSETAVQNDLLRPNRIVHTGDQFGYDYYSHIRQHTGWTAFQWQTRKWEFSTGASVNHHQYWREGLTQNGKFPESSFGTGQKHSFLLPSAKGLIRFKFDGRNYFTVLGSASSLPPVFRNAYVSPRTRDHVVENLVAEKLLSGEARYDYAAPYLKFSFSGFYITVADGIESTSFYHDDERTFVNFSLTGIDKRYTGIEAALQYTLVPGLVMEAAATWGQYIYTSRPLATITQDNDGSILQKDITVYAKNYYLGETPQKAYTAGLTYRSKKYWSIYVNLNRFEEQFIPINPMRRTITAIDIVELDSDQWHEILGQEEIHPVWTVDISFYKSFKADWLFERAILAFNFSVSNLLNEQDYINGGYEQYRFDFESRNVNKFPSRYSYMQGLTYFTQVSLRF